MSRKSLLQELQKRIAYTFLDPALLDRALTHTSFVKGDGKGSAHNERLEFLGDAVLELCISEQLYERFPKWSEGEMTRARARLVCEKALNGAARKEFGLQEFLLLGHGEESTGGRDKPSILSDALEALIGAVYLDGGLEAARGVILRFAEEMIASIAQEINHKDDKTTLQEYVQKWHLGSISYQVVAASGPDHQKEFDIHAMLNNACIGEGRGHSKQEAGQRAARAALEKLMGGGHTGG